MKNLNLLLMLSLSFLLIVSCIKDDFLETENTDSFELKSAEEKGLFEGICTFVEFDPVDNDPPNTWYDETDDWRTTGITIWEQPNLSEFKGTATLYVGAKNPDDEYDTIEFVCEGGRPVFETDAEGEQVDIDEETNTYCDKC
ncbi:MAG: hypothetical protein R3182_06245, partial [Draconibacterium sp.]|nr:hypothetical protein [Draconibacterium sp.]